MLAVPASPTAPSTPASRRRRARAAVAAAAIAVLTLSACHSNTNGSAQGSPVANASTPGASTSAVEAPSSSAAPAPVISGPRSTTNLNPTTPVTLSVTNGTLSAVSLLTPDGRKVAGTLAADATSWQSTEDLGYGRSYRLTALAVNAAGTQSRKSATITTLTPPNMTMPYLQRTGGYTLENGATYGVGIVPVVHFDEPITDKAAAQRTLSVTTSPHVAGSWYWVDDQNVHYRPQHYWPSGTKVTVTAKVYGVQVSPGLYGQSDVSASFRIGRTQITYAYDYAPAKVNQVVVKDGAGRVLREMNTSMGRHSSITVDGRVINFYTMYGTYTVLEHDNPAIMSSASYGLPANAPGGYGPEPIYYATKISTDGVYLHQLDTTVYAQDHGIDTSHGCLNLNRDNAVWYYQHSLVGDPVEIPNQHNGAPPIQIWQGGDWSIPWSTWVAGSALH